MDRVRSRVEAHLVAAYCAELKKLMDRGRFEAAEPLARAALEIDPYAETALYHLAMAMASSGRITAGLGEIRSAREKFRAELGRPLPAAFGELEARLESTEAFEARRRPGPNPKTLVLPFVGREEEFSHLRAAWDGIAATGRRIVLVSGEPGIGKTRLVERLGRLASIEGGRVLHADCYAAHRRVPFAAISEALRGLRPEEVGRLDTIWRRVLFAALSLEAAGFAEPGAGWQLARDGEIGRDGRIPISTFGGLKARGNPAGATGVYQIVEVARQLRGKAGDNQVADAQIGMAQNLGGSGATAVTHVLTVSR